jgi:hypothetical protein
MSWCPSAAEGMCNPEPERVPAAVQLIQPVSPPQPAVIPPSVATAHPAAVMPPGAPHYTVLTQSTVASPLAAAAPQPVVSPPAAMLPSAHCRHCNHASGSHAARSPSSPRRLAACRRSPARCFQLVVSPSAAAQNTAASQPVVASAITPQPLATQSTAAAQTVINDSSAQGPRSSPGARALKERRARLTRR